MIIDPWFYAFAVPAVIIVGISKGGFGGGIGVLATPLIAITVPVPQAAAILLPILCFMDLFTVWEYRRDWDGRHLRLLIPAAFAGIALGAVTFRLLDAAMIRIIIGGVAVVFAAQYYLDLRPRLKPGPHFGAAGLWGSVSGYTSFIAHAGGPPFAIYLLPQELEKRVFVGTAAIYFIFINYIKIVPYAWLGQFHGENLLTALVLLPLAPLGIWLGVWMQNRMATAVFYRVCYAMLLIVGGKLVYDGLTG